MEATLQTIFRQGFAQYQAQHQLSMDQHRAARAIMACRSEGFGYDEWRCPNGDHQERQTHSCRHRSCPRCHGAQTQAWLEKTKERLLPIDHYHVIFTLPHELNPIWYYNRRWSTEKLFKACTETLAQLLNDERYLGAEVGMLCSLHTWGRTLSFHPHLHVLVTGGGLRGDTSRAVDNSFLLPVGVLKAKFLGKWLDWMNRAYAAGELLLPPGWTESDWLGVLRRVAKKSWNIRMEGAYRHGQGVAVYLSRYVNGGPIKDQRLIDASSDQVRFRYRDHHDGRNKEMKLTSDHFMKRVLWHVATQGQHQTRYYGLYVAGAKAKRNRIREITGLEPEAEVPMRKKPIMQCPNCGVELLRSHSMRSGISFIRYTAVQQGVEVDRLPASARRGMRVNDPPTTFFVRAAAT